MNIDIEHRFAAFVEAIEKSAFNADTNGVAMHHSAVEVNSWGDIQQALQAATAVSGEQSKDKLLFRE